MNEQNAQNREGIQGQAPVDLDEDLENEELGERQPEACSLDEECEVCT